MSGPLCSGRVAHDQRAVSHAKPVFLVALAMVLALATAAPVLAESGKGASFCSESGVPAGYELTG
jgi:hypothetical protein